MSFALDIVTIIAVSAAGSGQRSGEASASSRLRVQFTGSTATPPTSAGPTSSGWR